MTDRVGRALAISLAAGILAYGLAACGDDADSPGATTGASKSTPAHGSEKRATAESDRNEGRPEPGSPKEKSGPDSNFAPKDHDDSGGGSAQFRTPGGDNSVQDFGEEAGEEDFRQAAAALHAYLDARAAGAWRAACSYMTRGLTESLAELAGGQDGGEGGAPDCPSILAALSAGIPERSLRQAAIADVASLRAYGDRGFLLFHGAQGVDYFVPMAREEGAWKVAAIAPSTLG